MVIFLTGNEPYLIKNYLTKFKQEMTFPEMNFMQCEELSEQSLDFLMHAPFLDKRKVLVWRTSEAKGQVFEKLYEVHKDKDKDSTLFIVKVDKLDKRGKLYKELSKEKSIVECNKLSEPELATFIKNEVEKEGCTIDNNTLDFFQQRLAYQEVEETSLYTVKNYITQLCFSEKAISKEGVAKILPERIEAKSFLLFSFITSGKSKEAYKHMYKLLDDGESAIMLLSLILRNYRVCFKAKLVGKEPSKIGLTSKQLSVCKNTEHMETSALYDCMVAVQTAVNQIKDGNKAETVVAALFSKLLPCSK